MPLTAAGRFAVYGPSHWAALGLFAVGCAGLVLLGRSQRTAEPGFGGQARGFGRAYALAIVYVMIGTQVHTLLPGQWRIGGSLPLQLCDVAWPAAVGALWTLGRRWFALTYYWGSRSRCRPCSHRRSTARTTPASTTSASSGCT